MDNRITEHPILTIPDYEVIEFSWDGKKLSSPGNLVISSALFINGIKIFGYHPKDGSPQGMFCANGQCAQCTVIANGKPVKSCMTPLEAGMVIKSCSGLPELPPDDKLIPIADPGIYEIEVLVIGAGPSGLSATSTLAEYGINVLLIDDKDRLGGKLVLQTHKFFGSQSEVHAGKRGFKIAEILGNKILTQHKVDIWLNSTALSVFSDGMVGILQNNNNYTLVKPRRLFIATGAREKMLAFPGDTLPGVYGAGAFQTLVNRDLVKPSEKIFIIGGGNVGLIAGYHAIQAGIDVVGLVEALPQCGGYKVHEDKLRRLGVPIYTSYTILSANGQEKVESVTVGKLDERWNLIPNTEKSFKCDTILIAVGLEPVDEFYHKAVEFGIETWVAGDAQEIAEASAAIFTGKLEAIKMLKSLGIETKENVEELEKKALMMKEKPPDPIEKEPQKKETGLFPVFHCHQEIPCNPCASVCPQGMIHTEDDILTRLPYFYGEKECSGCARCVAICPGLAITLLDYRADQKNPFVTIPFEIPTKKLEKGEKVTVMGDSGPLGQFEVIRTRILKKYPQTQLITIKIPRNLAKEVVNIRMQDHVSHQPMEIYHKPPYPDEAIVCRCERVTAGEIRKWIRSGVTDVNELKTLTRAQMGACGGKTCTSLIQRIFREEGIEVEKITKGTLRPLFVEVPFSAFVKEGRK
jgi:NADPH-dependent 2,4-dienoyl-CoA reductase/sulfur reductase-like enzyme/NAD-dependent dihydropyrimidine dehydrogenase PreA subunit/bacterioferritin-associated ferredoxin